jgi:hypothetical protein
MRPGTLAARAVYRCMNATRVFVVFFFALAIVPVAATASPGASSIESSDGSVVYMVSPDGGGATVTKIRGSDRTAQVSRRLAGSFALPSVAGSRGGLAPDGNKLVLEGHPAPHASQFAVLNARTLRVERVLSLKGSYSFDAMSPSGKTLFVLRYLSRDHTHYAVQSLDLTDASPVARTLVEKGEPGEAMSGTALTRTTSPDGAWVYTLYEGAGEAPFVHALSTVDKYTVCIDLDALEGRRDLSSLDLRLTPATDTLAVTASGAAVAEINTASFEVTTPPAPPPAAANVAARHPREDSTDLPWLPIALLALVAATAKLLLRRQRASTNLSH